MRQVLRTVFLILIVWPTGAWLLYLPFRLVKRGSFKYRLSTVKRSAHPVWFWFYAIASGVCGAMLIVLSLYLLLTPR
jgi:hypothetical protein